MFKNCLVMIAALLILISGKLIAQTSEEGKAYARNWLRTNCAEAGDNGDEAGSFLKYQTELRTCFLSAIQRGLELDEMRAEEAAFGEIYDQNLKMLNESKPAWITPEQEKKLRAVSREVFVAEAKEKLAQDYKTQALRGLELIRLLQSK
jgi:hypothetical protein